jgi:hypothetical protein
MNKLHVIKIMASVKKGTLASNQDLQFSQTLLTLFTYVPLMQLTQLVKELPCLYENQKIH